MKCLQLRAAIQRRAEGLGRASLQGMFAPGGRPPFKMLRRGPAVEQVLVGDFVGDGIDDVFTTIPEDRFHRWLFSSKGTGECQRPGLGSPMHGLKFGHFDDDRKIDVIDVIDAVDRGNGLEWLMSSGGAASWVGLRPAVADTASVRVGDSVGDGKADVLTWERGDGKVRYLFLCGGRGESIPGPVERPPLGVGDFDRDGKADAFFMTGADLRRRQVSWAFDQLLAEGQAFLREASPLAPCCQDRGASTP